MHAASLIAQLETGLPHLSQLADQQMATTALTGARRVQRLVDDLLVLANGDEGTLVLRRELIDLDEIVLGVTHAMRTTTSTEIDTSAVSAAAAVVDSDRIAQVVTNLIANAGRSAAGGCAGAETGTTGNWSPAVSLRPAAINASFSEPRNLCGALPP